MAFFWVNVTFTLPLKCEECWEEKYKFDYISSVFVSIDRVPEIHCLTMQNYDPKKKKNRKSFEYHHMRHVFL